MALYQLTQGNTVVRTTDGAHIPITPIYYDPEDPTVEIPPYANADYRVYLDWVAAGNTPDPADPLPIRKTSTLLVDKEVRTTSATPIEVFRFPTNPNHTYKAVFEMMAVDAVSKVVKNTEAKMTFQRNGGGVLAQVGTTAILYTAANPAATAWTITPSVSGTDLVISVTGAAGRTIDWMLVGNIGVYAPGGLV